MYASVCGLRSVRACVRVCLSHSATATTQYIRFRDPGWEAIAAGSGPLEVVFRNSFISQHNYKSLGSLINASKITEHLDKQ